MILGKWQLIVIISGRVGANLQTGASLAGIETIDVQVAAFVFACQQAGHGYWLWWRYRHGLHPAGYPQQWRADLCSGGDRVRFLAVFSLAGADGGVPVFGIN